MKNLTVLSPKREQGSNSADGEVYPFYPGFSDHFTEPLIESAALDKNACVMDPWNGSGTTTAAAARLGIRTYGFDLNPVMVIVAKARQVTWTPKRSLRQLAAKIVRRAKDLDFHYVTNDPLLTWYAPQSVLALRRCELAIQRIVVDERVCQPLALRCTYAGVSEVAAFYYTALFRTVRAQLIKFSSSNPTWTKKPKTDSHRLRPRLESIALIFENQVEAMISSLESKFSKPHTEVKPYIDLASSDSLPLPDRSVDLVVTSPPYCTRIDYAVATGPELAVLGYTKDAISETLRKKLIGTPTVRSQVPTPSAVWGPTCLKFLESVRCHPSRASSTYYYKNHVQYFQAIYESISELYRCLKKHGTCVIVVQDSYYKELHNDLPQIFIEMASNNRLALKRRVDFPFSRTMARLHPGVRNYRNGYGGVESVLCFEK